MYEKVLKAVFTNREARVVAPLSSRRERRIRKNVEMIFSSKNVASSDDDIGNLQR